MTGGSTLLPTSWSFPSKHAMRSENSMRSGNASPSCFYRTRSKGLTDMHVSRAQIEEDYGERLLKLSQMEVGRAEQGTLAESVSHIPSAIEITARAHVDLANQLRQHLQAPLDGFTNDQSEKRKAVSWNIKEHCTRG